MSEHEQQNKVPAALMNPESQAYLNQTIASAVSEAMKGAMQFLGPVLASVALTPERMNELKKPFEDPARAARDKRDRIQFKAQVDEQQKNDALKKAYCSHRHKTGTDAIQLVHNFPDRQVRGTCSLCADWIHPKEWRIGAPTEQNPLGKPYVVPPHKDYGRVLALDSGSASPIDSVTPVTIIGQMQQNEQR